MTAGHARYEPRPVADDPRPLSATQSSPMHTDSASRSGGAEGHGSNVQMLFQEAPAIPLSQAFVHSAGSIVVPHGCTRHPHSTFPRTKIRARTQQLETMVTAVRRRAYCFDRATGEFTPPLPSSGAARHAATVAIIDGVENPVDRSGVSASATSTMGGQATRDEDGQGDFYHKGQQQQQQQQQQRQQQQQQQQKNQRHRRRYPSSSRRGSLQDQSEMQRTGSATSRGTLHRAPMDVAETAATAAAAAATVAVKEAVPTSERGGVHQGVNDDPLVVGKQKAFVKLMGKLGMRGRANEVLELMYAIQADGSPPFNVFMYNACITALARCGRWKQALDVLDGMRRDAAVADAELAAGRISRANGAVVRPDVVSYSAAITACGNAGQRRRAFALLSEMRGAGVLPNVVSYNAAAKACIDEITGDERNAERARISSIHTGGVSHDETGRHSKINKSDEDRGGWHLVMGLMAEMREYGIAPDVFTFSTAITACGRAGQWKLALSLLDEMAQGEAEDQLAPDVVAINSAISACGRAGQWEIAVELLERMTTADGRLVGSTASLVNDDYTAPDSLQESSYATLAAAFREGGHNDGNARDVCNDDGIAGPAWPVADAISFNSAVEACSKAGHWRSGMSLLPRMLQARIRPDIRTCASILACLRAGGQWERSLEFLEEMEADPHQGLSPDLGCYGVVMSTLAEAGEWERTLAILRRLQRTGTHEREGSAEGQAWSTRDATRAEADMRGSALISSLPSAGPNIVCYNAALAACARAAAPIPALELLDEMETRGIFDTSSYNCVMHACRGEGQWQKATAILDRMLSGDKVTRLGGEVRTVPPPDACSFTSAIAACGAVGEADRALEVLRSMYDAGVIPTVVAFNAAIAAVARGIHRQRNVTKNTKEAKPSEVAREETGRPSGGSGSDSRASTVAGSLATDEVTAGAEATRDSWKRASDLVAEMRDVGVVPNTSSYNAVLAACQKAGAWEDALAVLEEMKRGTTNRPGGPAIAEEGSHSSSPPVIWIGDTVPSPDVVSFNTAIGACGRADRWQEAVHLLDELSTHDLSPDAVSYNMAAVACARVRKWSLALEVINRGRRAGAITTAVEMPSHGEIGKSVGNKREDGDGDGTGTGGRGTAGVKSFYTTVEIMARREERGGSVDQEGQP